MEGLGSLFEEPLWAFHRDDITITRFSGFEEMRVAIGPDGSGTQALVRRLIRDIGLDPEKMQLLELGWTEAADALIAGEVDVALFVSSPSSREIDRLLRSPEIVASSFERAEAYARRYVFFHEVSLPEGTIDLKANVPKRELKMVSSTANLIAHEDLHPALACLLLEAAGEKYGGGSVFSEAGKFPTPNFLDFPLSEAAKDYYKRGPPFLQRYLPFWAASLIDRMKIMLLPLLILLLPMFKVMPSLYRWRMNARVYSWYSELEAIELHLGEDGPDSEVAEKLNDLENDVKNIKVPLAFAGQLYVLRQHIELIRGKVAGHSQPGFTTDE